MLLLWLLAVPAFAAIPGLPLGPDSKGLMQCPRSKSPVHAWAKTMVTFKNSCKKVQEEIHARLNHEMTNKGNKWHDPHNGGSYKDMGIGMYTDKKTGNTYDQIQTRRTAGGFPHFKDNQYFTFVPQARNDVRSSRGKNNGGDDDDGMGCLVYACSVSQGVSATDGGTNFCDTHDLYCNSMDNCEWVKYDLDYDESFKKTNLGSRDNKWLCTGRPKHVAEMEALEAEDHLEVEA